MRVIGTATFVISLCLNAPSAWAQLPAAPSGEPGYDAPLPGDSEPAPEEQSAPQEEPADGEPLPGDTETPPEEQAESTFDEIVPDESATAGGTEGSLAFVLVMVIVLAGVGGAAWFFLKNRGRQTPALPQSPVEPAPTSRPVDARAAATPKVTSIFISYRREDSADISGRINDRLVERFGRNAVFKDVNSIPIGRDFRTHIRDAVGRCDALLVIIGRQWSEASANGKRRLDDPRDHLRIEVESALGRNIPVIPVLVQGAVMPEEEALPESLRPLAYRNAIPVRPDPDFDVDLERLIRGMEAQFGTPSAS